MKHSLKNCRIENNRNVQTPTCVETTFAFLRLRLEPKPPSPAQQIGGESERGWGMTQFAMHLTALKFSRNI